MNKKGMLDRPQDFVIMFMIVALVVVTAGFGVQSVEYQGATTNSVTFFDDVKGDVTSTTGLKGTADEASDVIDPSDQALQSEVSEENIITEGLQSLRSIGGTLQSTRNAMTESGSILSIDPIYISTVVFTMIIILFVLIYTWARGR